MKRIAFFTLSLCIGLSAMAQETYDNAKLLGEDLNGTARYVGMGGAMDALGADISVINSNPAGIGLFRSSGVNVSFGAVSQSNASNFGSAKKTNMSFDQIGLVYAKRTGKNSFLNVAFNYHKSKNFDFILSAADRLQNASQNKLSYIKGSEGLFEPYVNSNGYIMGQTNQFNQMDYLYYNTLLTSQGDDGTLNYNFDEANSYDFKRGERGYIGEYDFNISGNIHDRVYLGLTFGIHDVHWRGTSLYGESIVSGGDVSTQDERKISGTGFSVKGGIIVRPIEDSPFRVGLSVSTPVWYDLTMKNTTDLQNNTNYGADKYGKINEAYDFKLYTPWKFGFSLGTTIGQSLALGAVYEYSDYSSVDSRINTGSSYDWYYDEYYDESSSDHEMNRHAEETLKGVSTLKLGVEFKPEVNLAVRLGYNYVSPVFKKTAYKDVALDSPGTYYTSTTDYTNWQDTHRLTCGLGYTVDKWNIDLAYQFSTQKGNFSPFTNYYGDKDASMDNVCQEVKVKNERHQVLLTLGYRF